MFSDCGSIEGGNGIYAIAPGEGPPLLVACDMSSSPGGWTIVQRRIDGSQEFNRKWKEYAVGFGVPSGKIFIYLFFFHATWLHIRLIVT